MKSNWELEGLGAVAAVAASAATVVSAALRGWPTSGPAQPVPAEKVETAHPVPAAAVARAETRSVFLPPLAVFPTKLTTGSSRQRAGLVRAAPVGSRVVLTDRTAHQEPSLQFGIRNSSGAL